MIVGGPGCGKSSFTRSLLSERGFTVADVSDIYEKEAVSKRVKSFCGKGGLDTIISSGGTAYSTVTCIWIHTEINLVST